MRLLLYLLLLTSYTVAQERKPYTYKYKNWQSFLGNNKESYLLIGYMGEKPELLDIAEDTIKFKKYNGVYIDSVNKLYVKTTQFLPLNDVIINREYFYSIEEYADYATYKVFPNHDMYFSSKGKVYYWWINSGGEYPVKIEKADTSSFVPFENKLGGKDNKRVFFQSYELKGVNPKKVQWLLPKDYTFNGDNYIKDDKLVYYGIDKVINADAPSFKIITHTSFDAEDKNAFYFEGKIKKRK